MNLTQQIEELIEAAQQHLDSPGESEPQRIQSDLSRVMDEIDGLLAGWEPAPDSLKTEIEAMDRQFIAAGELYLDACDDIQEALDTGSTESLKLARQTLKSAGKQLEVADLKANDQFKKWVDPGGCDPRSCR